MQTKLTWISQHFIALCFSDSTDIRTAWHGVMLYRRQQCWSLGVVHRSDAVDTPTG